MKHNLSAACGAWGPDGHAFCTGQVLLPPPLDRCTCPCHEPSESKEKSA